MIQNRYTPPRSRDDRGGTGESSLKSGAASDEAPDAASDAAPNAASEVTSNAADATADAAPNAAAAAEAAPPPDESERKERVLHTRIPESLDDAVRAAASELGMSVSNLVRNVLANALEVVEAAAMRVPARAAAAAAAVRAGTAAGGSAAGGSARDAAAATAAAAAAASAAAVHAGAAPGAPAEAPLVLGWQEATLAVNAVCDRCNAILARGRRAAISIPDRPTAQRAIRCLACLEELTRDPDAATPDR